MPLLTWKKISDSSAKIMVTRQIWVMDIGLEGQLGLKDVYNRDSISATMALLFIHKD